MKTPYVVGPPVRLPGEFFGRERQARQFFDTLAGPQLQCVSILGLRRAGKTSFLQYITQPEVIAAFLPDAQRYMMVYVDISACKTAADFYTRLYQRLLGGLPRVPAGVVRSRHSADAYDVESLLHEFVDRRVVLLLDEFDQIRTAGYSPDFMTELRALAGLWDFELAYVTASYWDLYRLGQVVGLPPTSPFYNIFYPTPIYLSGLTPAELDDLVTVPARRVGVVADDEDVAFVRHLAGTMPFFVQAAASAWLAYKAQGRAPDRGSISQRLVSEMWPYFEQWWRNFSDVERDVVSAVAQEKPVDRLPYDKREIELAVQRLTNYGVVVPGGVRLSIDSALFADWLREYAVRAKRKAPATAAATARTNGHAHAAAAADGAAARALTIIEEVSRQFERLPAVYARKSDDALREQLEIALRLGLGGTGAGAGEANRVAVDCATWTGQKSLLRRVDGVLGQIGMANSSAAVVIFVRSPELALVTQAVRQAMQFHPAYLGYAGGRGGRLDFQLHLNGDPHSEVTLTTLLVHLPA